MTLALQAKTIAVLQRHVSRRGRSLHDTTLPELNTRVVFGGVLGVGVTAKTYPAQRYCTDASEIAYASCAAGAIPLLVGACTNHSVSTCNNYQASQRSTLPLMECVAYQRRCTRQRLMHTHSSLGRDAPAAARAESQAALDACLPAPSPLSANDYGGEKANSHFARSMKQHLRYSPNMVHRTRRSKKQGWVRECSGRIGRLQNRSQRRLRPEAIQLLSNTYVLAPCCTYYKHVDKNGHVDPLIRRPSGRGVGEFVPREDVKKPPPIEEEEDTLAEPVDDEDEHEAPEDEHALDEYEARGSDLEDDPDEDVVYEVQCAGCKGWHNVRHRVHAWLQDHGEQASFFCSPDCHSSGVQPLRKTTNSPYHDEWVLEHTVTKDGRVFGKKIGETKVEQNERSVMHRASVLRAHLGDVPHLPSPEPELQSPDLDASCPHVHDLSTTASRIIVGGHGARTARALPELYLHLRDHPAPMEWGNSSLPPVIVLTLLGYGGLLVRHDGDRVVVRLTKPNESVVGCLAIECTIANWRQLRGPSALARVLKCTRTNGLLPLSNCVGGSMEGGYLPKHVECPDCGIDMDAMPPGIDLPARIAHTKKWALDDTMRPVVDGCIARMVYATRCVKKASTRADMITGQLIYEALERSSAEWLIYLGDTPTEAYVNLGAHALAWLRTTVVAMSPPTTSTGRGENVKQWGVARLLGRIAELPARAPLPFHPGEAVLAHWMVEKRGKRKRGKRVLIPEPNEWLRGTVLGRGEGVGVCVRVLFSDGHTHPGVPLAHVRNL